MVKYKCSICSNEYEQKNKSKSGKCKKCYKKEYAKKYMQEHSKEYIQKSKEKHKRHCPECGKELSYPSAAVYKKAIEKNSLCHKCSSTKEQKK